MHELTSNQAFILQINPQDIRDYIVDDPNYPPPRAPIRSLSFDCPCGQNHTFQRNPLTGRLCVEGYDWVKAIESRREGRPIDPPYVAAWINDEKFLVECPKLNGLVHINVKKRVLKQHINVLGFISYETLNAAEHGFGLRIQTNIGTLDFNNIGQSRSDYPTKELTTRAEFEEKLLSYSEDLIDNLNRYMPELKDSSYQCPCGDTHSMGGTREDLSIFQWGDKFTPQPIFAVYKDIHRKESEGLVYRCSERYTMLSGRPSMPALWSAKIDLIWHDQKKETRLNSRLFSQLSSLTDMVRIDGG